MNKLKILACGALLFGAGFMLSGCKTTPDLKTFESNKIVLGADVTYDGKSNIFGVFYRSKNNEQINLLESEDYDVTYSTDGENYVEYKYAGHRDAGSYDIWYKISKKGYKDFVGKHTFRIKPKEITAIIPTITDYIENAKSKQALVENIVLKYSGGTVVQNETPFVNYIIEDYDRNTAKAGDSYVIKGIDIDSNYDITFVDGKYTLADTASVTFAGQTTYYSTLTEALKNTELGATVTLYTDITDEVVCLDATDKNYDFTLDLNGYNINKGIKLRNYGDDGVKTNYGITATIYSSSTTKSVVGSEGFNGILINGNDKFNITLRNIKFEGSNTGIITNGLHSGSRINASNCSFGTETSSNGAYMPAEYTYMFANCTFTGLTAYYTKSGEHVLDSCVFIATKEEYSDPSYNNNGSDETGSALVVDSAASYIQPMKVIIIDGTFESAAGYGIEECTTGGVEDYATITRYGKQNYTVAEGKENFIILDSTEE